MPIFKKLKKPDDSSNKSTLEEDATTPKVKIKKKTKIGFGKKKKQLNKEKKVEKQKEEIKEENIEEKFESVEKEDTNTQTDVFTENILELNDEVEKTEVKEKNKQWSPVTKRKSLIPKDMKGKPVFLEDTGEKLGIVYEIIYDEENRTIGYKIKDKKSDSILSFPADQFDENKDGLIFVQGWYTKAIKTIEQLEFKEKVSPELTTLLEDDALSNEELYNIFVKHDDQMAHYIEDAISLKELLNRRLNALEKQRLALKDNLMDLTEKRLIKDIDRREFSEDVMKHRRKVNILDVNINKCKDLLKRLDETSFGRLGKHIVTNFDEKEKNRFIENFVEDKEKHSVIISDEIENPYKQKYNDMKVRFEQLEEDYNELKLAVEKLVEKDEL